MKEEGRGKAGVHVFTRCRERTIAALQARSSQYFRPLHTIERETLKPEKAFFGMAQDNQRQSQKADLQRNLETALERDGDVDNTT